MAACQNETDTPPRFVIRKGFYSSNTKISLAVMESDVPKETVRPVKTSLPWAAPCKLSA